MAQIILVELDWIWHNSLGSFYHSTYRHLPGTEWFHEFLWKMTLILTALWMYSNECFWKRMILSNLNSKTMNWKYLVLQRFWFWVTHANWIISELKTLIWEFWELFEMKVVHLLPILQARISAKHSYWNKLVGIKIILKFHFDKIQSFGVQNASELRWSVKWSRKPPIYEVWSRKPPITYY